jgi:hypothetical protein
MSTTAKVLLFWGQMSADIQCGGALEAQLDWGEPYGTYPAPEHSQANWCYKQRKIELARIEPA